VNLFDELITPASRKNRLFFVVDFWDVSPHIDTSLEIVLRLAELNINVFYSCLAYSTIFPNYRKHLYGPDISARLEDIYSQLYHISNVKVIQQFPLSNCSNPIVKCPKSPTSASLLQLNTKGCMVGSSILASLSTGQPLSIYPYLFTHNHINTIKTMIDSYTQVYESAKMFFDQEIITDVVVCNGIHLHSNAVYSAANRSKRSVTTHFHERGQNPSKFLLTSIEPPHSMDKFLLDYKSFLLEHLMSSASIKIDGCSENYFRNNIKLSKHPALKLVNNKDLFNCLGKRRRLSDKFNVTLFTSSDAEQITSGPTFTLPGGWSSQIEFMVDFVLAYKFSTNIENLNLSVRIHPNISSYHKDDLMRQLSLFDSLSNCKLYLPDDSCDSYELASESDIVVSYGSTISLESAYLGIPSFVSSPTPYELCGLVPRVYHFQQLKEMFDTPANIIKSYSHLPLFMFDLYCHFLENREISHKYYVADGFSSGLFKNQPL